jgi:hypothetical protein
MKKLKNLLDLKNMKHVVLLLFIGILFVQCQKDELEQKKDNTYQLKLNYLIENHTVTESIPTKMTLGNGYSSSGFVQRSIDIDENNTTDLVVMGSYTTLNNFLIRKSFQITEVKDSIEIAIQPTANYGMDNDTLHVINVFDAPALIESYTNWYKVSAEKICLLSYYYDYTQHVYINNAPVIKSADQKINLNVNSKYLGIRKKIKNNYVYGWIRFSIENNEKLELLECCFCK